MKYSIFIIFFFLILTFLISSCSRDNLSYEIPVEYHKLENGLKVVLSPDNTAPLAVVAVYYNIGFRIEPKDRTGFAHLFEHMMFQGSKNLGKMEFVKLVQSNGGALNGSTRFDFTNYFEIIPSHKLETLLWAEADRMKGLSINQENLTNQQGVVINEVKVNVHNRAYGGFPWLDMPQYANENWYNAHNFYGDLSDIEAATLKDVQKFFDTYYAPNNAAVVIVGDFIPEEALGMVDKYFGGISAVKSIEKPDISEPPQVKVKRFTQIDSLAKRPALAFSYHMPKRNSPEYYAMGLIDQILLQGIDSKLNEVLVQNKGLTGSVDGGINLLGNMFNYNGPMLWTGYLFYDNNVSADTILNNISSVIKPFQNKLVDKELLNRAIVKVRSSLYDNISYFNGFGRADMLASFALFDDDPAMINKIENQFKKVTPELIQKTAKDYLHKEAQTVLIIEPKTVSQ